MKTIRHTCTLYYYDGAQVFEGRDAIGGHYLGVMVGPIEGRERYVIAGVEPERLRQFRIGSLDLRTLLLERAETSWFLASPRCRDRRAIAVGITGWRARRFRRVTGAGLFPARPSSRYRDGA